MNSETDRPEGRFAGDTELLDIHERASEMIDHAIASAHGRAQQTLYKHDTTTVALFAFRQDTGLPEHSAPGTVTIQVIAGEVTVTVATQSFELKNGQMLRIAPRVSHSVHAACNAAIMVHIALSPASS